MKTNNCAVPVVSPSIISPPCWQRWVKTSFIWFHGSASDLLLSISFHTGHTQENSKEKILGSFQCSSNQITLCRSGVWIGMKVLGANSIILGTRKLWWMFPIKQKLNITAAFFHTIRVIKMFKTRQFFWLSIVQFPCPPGLLIRLLHIGKKMSKLD